MSLLQNPFFRESKRNRMEHEYESEREPRSILQVPHIEICQGTFGQFGFPLANRLSTLAAKAAVGSNCGKPGCPRCGDGGNCFNQPADPFVRAVWRRSFPRSKPA